MRNCRRSGSVGVRFKASVDLDIHDRSHFVVNCARDRVGGRFYADYVDLDALRYASAFDMVQLRVSFPTPCHHAIAVAMHAIATSSGVCVTSFSPSLPLYYHWYG